MKLSVVIPAHNEEGSIKETVVSFHDELKKEKTDLEIEAVRLQSIDKIKSSQVASAMTQIKPSGYAQ